MKKKKLILLFISLFWIGFIFFNSLQEAIESSAISSPIVDLVYNLLEKINININYLTLSYIIRKFAHVFEYTILGTLIILNFIENKLTTKYCLSYGFASSVLVATTDEIIQTYVEGRSGSVIDVGYDSLGIIIGMVIVVLIYRFKSKRRY